MAYGVSGRITGEILHYIEEKQPDLTLAEFGVLMVLCEDARDNGRYERRARLSQRQIGARMNKTDTTVHRALHGLMRKKLVEREQTSRSRTQATIWRVTDSVTTSVWKSTDSTTPSVRATDSTTPSEPIASRSLTDSVTLSTSVPVPEKSLETSSGIPESSATRAARARVGDAHATHAEEPGDSDAADAAADMTPGKEAVRRFLEHAAGELAGPSVNGNAYNCAGGCGGTVSRSGQHCRACQLNRVKAPGDGHGL